MSLDDSYDSHEHFEGLVQAFKNLDGVKSVSSPEQVNTASGHAVMYRLYLTDEARNDELKRKEITETLVPLIMSPKPVDWWWGSKTASPLTFYTGGLNPDPSVNEGAHTTDVR